MEVTRPPETVRLRHDGHLRRPPRLARRTGQRGRRVPELDVLSASRLRDPPAAFEKGIACALPFWARTLSHRWATHPPCTRPTARTARPTSHRGGSSPIRRHSPTSVPYPTGRRSSRPRGCLFRTFKHTAFRLEVRDRYDASYENASLAKFLNGEEDDLPWMQDWLAMIREATKRGRRFSRYGSSVRPSPTTAASASGARSSRFLGGELVEDPAAVVQHNHWRDAAWHHAVRRDDFATE
ncbi:DUF6879 family protein [Streptomyces niveus]|uniref:DUF6879 family protein n=1 Tax=Streptomyces niveus TaxID=193462 RepID=UPI0036AC5B4D